MSGEGLLRLEQAGSLDERKADGGVSGRSAVIGISNYITDERS